MSEPNLVEGLSKTDNAQIQAKIQVKRSVPVSDSDSDIEDYAESAKYIKLSTEKRPVDDFNGGLTVISSSKNANISSSSSMTATEKKGQKEVEELERELDLKNTFSKETNRRDEETEMNKYIEEQVRLKRYANKQKNHGSIHEKSDSPDDLSNIFATNGHCSSLDDIILNSISKYSAIRSDEKNESMLSSQMLEGIPEIDLGVDETVRTIEETEKAKLELASNPKSEFKTTFNVPSNFACNYLHHKQSRSDELKRIERSSHNQMENQVELVVNVGDEPSKLPNNHSTNKDSSASRGKSSDDYYLAKFKKNMQNRR